MTDERFMFDSEAMLCRIEIRQTVVQEKLAQLEQNINKEAPCVPCCLLRTELDILQRLQDVLERQLHYVAD